MDRLLLLLDTGSSTSVRNTAAKQLAQLAAKSVISDLAVEDDIKSSRQHVSLGDPSAWAELMAVVARVSIYLLSCFIPWWIDMTAQIIPYLHSKSYETRTAASVALSHIFTLVPLWQPSHYPDTKSSIGSSKPLPPFDFPSFSVQELLYKGKLLLASSGKEFVKPAILSSSLEVKKARKEAMGRLGLDFIDAFGGEDDMELEKELADAEPDLDVEMENSLKIEETPPVLSPTAPSINTIVKKEHSASRSDSISPATPTPTTPTLPQPELTALSARERNRLKRKRKPGSVAFVAAPPPQNSGAKYTASTSGPSNK